MAGSIALACANRGAAVAWIAPTYRNSRPLWRFVESMTAPVSSRVDVRRADRVVAFPGGGYVGVYSADSPNSIRGEAFDLVIIDEAARIAEEVWTDAIQPTLADRDGRAYLISTPHGRNWFWREYMRADGERVASFTAPSNANPNPNIRRAYEMARERVSDRTFRQEWNAEFIEDGAFFANVEACATAEPQSCAAPGHAYVIGVDWARASGGDYTVYAVVDATAKACVHVERYSGMDFGSQRERLRDLWLRFNKPAIIAEYNAMGGPQVEALQAAGLPVTGFTTTAATKHEIISTLELAFDKRDIRILQDSTLLRELAVYERRDRAGLPGYGAPAGEHDDCVIALALAWWGARGHETGVIAEAIV